MKRKECRRSPGEDTLLVLRMQVLDLGLDNYGPFAELDMGCKRHLAENAVKKATTVL